MAESRNTSDTELVDENMNGSRGMGTAVMSATQDAAEMARVTAQRAAERLPDAVAGAQTAMTQTQARLNEMDNDALLVGTSFSLGLAVGLFLSGANRFLIAAALAPAGAMVLTMLGRQQTDTGSGSASMGNRRSTRAGASAGE